MNLNTNLHGRLRNTSLPYSNGLLPVYETVANSIHSVEDAELEFTKSDIIVKIVRDPQSTHQTGRGPDPKAPIIGFEILDNGIGFNDDNFQSFLTLDSEFKAKRGGRGVGRLLWLKAFESAEVKSVYLHKGAKCLREFVFSGSRGVVVKHDCKQVDSSTPIGTSVYLANFSKAFRERTPKTVNAIARAMFEHCLWYYLRPSSAPKIRVADNEDSVSLLDVYDEHIGSSMDSEQITIGEYNFDLIHVKLSPSSNRQHSVSYCAANRLVKTESITGKIPGLYGNLQDDDGEFVYHCYVSSPFLDERVRSERTAFDIANDPLDIFKGIELSMADIRDGVLDAATRVLDEVLENKISKSKERISKFVDNSAPRYRPIMSRVSESDLAIDPEISDKDLELHLHKHLAEFERETLAEGHRILRPADDETPDAYSRRLKSYLQSVSDLKKSDLADYVGHRRVVIDLLESALTLTEQGRYEKEDVVHNLIMPMRETSNDLHSDDGNLWLLDERLVFHNFLASDKTLKSMPITDSNSGKEPDILALNVFDNPVLVTEGKSPPYGSLVIVEIKRPMRNDAKPGEKDDPIEQTLGYLERIRSGGVKTADGRPISNAENIPGYCYIVCDITPSIKSRCKIHNLKQTSDGLGFFDYRESLSTYIEVMSFEKIVMQARQRNRVFFDKLGLPT